MKNKAVGLMLLLLAVVLFVSLALATERDSFAGDNFWTWLGLLGAHEVRAIEVAPDNSQFIIVGISTGGALWCTTDGGAVWYSCNNGVPPELSTVYDIEIAQDNPNLIYAASDRGLLKSVDRAASWEVVLGQGLPYSVMLNEVTINPADSNIVMTQGVGGIGDLARTTDGGQTWEGINVGTQDDYAVQIAFAPGAPHIAYAAGTGAYRSEDYGQTWTDASGGFVTKPYIETMAVDPYSSDILYMASHSSLYRTANGGASWAIVSSGMGSTDIRDIKIDPGNQQLIYVGSYSPPGLYRSTDSAGSGWEHLNQGIEGQPVMGVGLNHEAPQKIYAGTVTGGIFDFTATSGTIDFSVSINDGALFTNQTAVTLTLTAPPQTSQMIVSNDGGFGGATWESFSSQRVWTIQAIGDHVIPRVVYAKFKTNGQISGLYQDDIILDITSPTGTVEVVQTHPSMTGDKPPQRGISLGKQSFVDSLTPIQFLPSLFKNYRQGYTMITLSLSASDDLSGVGYMLIGNDSAFSGSSWEIFSTTRDWWVLENVETVVHVKFRDRAGNESSIATAIYNP